MMLAYVNASLPPVPIEVTVDASALPAPFEHKWKKSFGSGHASLTLRKDWRDHMSRAVKELGLSGVRYHGMYDDDMHVVPAPGVYNFTAVESTWNFLVQQNVHPIVELSFMPAFLANCSWHGHCKPDPVGCTGYWCTQCNGHGELSPPINPAAPDQCARLEFWYQGIKQLPYLSDYSRWYELVRATVQRAVDLFGLPEVQRWQFEVWNELWGLTWPDCQHAQGLKLRGARTVGSHNPSPPLLMQCDSFLGQTCRSTTPRRGRSSRCTRRYVLAGPRLRCCSTWRTLCRHAATAASPSILSPRITIRL